MLAASGFTIATAFFSRTISMNGPHRDGSELQIDERRSLTSGMRYLELRTWTPEPGKPTKRPTVGAAEVADVVAALSRWVYEVYQTRLGHRRPKQITPAATRPGPGA